MSNIIKYDIATIIKQLEETTNQKAKQVGLDCYTIGNITEQNLLDCEFKFTEKSFKENYPIYTKGNIEAIFIGNLLTVRETTI